MDLKSITGIVQGWRSLPMGQAAHPFSLLRPGIPRNALTEISGAPGSGKSELLLRFLAENPSLRVAWIESELTAYPCAFPQMGVALDRVLFTESGSDKDALWIAHQCLRSQLFGVVVISNKAIGELELRRLQLAAEKAQASVILVNEAPTRTASWPIALQVQIVDRCIGILKGSGVKHAIG